MHAGVLLWRRGRLFGLTRWMVAQGAVLLQRDHQSLYDFLGVEHPGLDGIRGDVIEESVNLGLEDLGLDPLDRLDSSCVLGGDGGDGRGPET